MDRRLLATAIFVLWMLLVGCTTVAPSDRGEAPGATRSAPADSMRADPSVRRVEAGADSLKRALRVMRENYVDGAYGEVVRRARTARGDSLSPEMRTQVYTLIGRAEQARGRHEVAIDALQQARVAAVETDQSVTHLDRLLGESYAATYQWSLAASAFGRVLERAPTDLSARLALGEVYRQSRQWQKAQSQYTRLVRADSSNGEWWARLAQCDVQLREISRAVQHYELAHEQLPQSADVALSLSRLYRITMKQDAAREVIRTTLKHQPQDSRLWRRKADLAFEDDQLEIARRAYERTIATGDSSATPYRRIGLIDVRQKEYARALSALNRSYDLDSTHTRTTLYLGIAHLRLDSLNAASKQLQRTIDLEAEGPITRALVYRGEVRNEQGLVSEAVRSYKTALRLQPGRSSVYFRLATAYDRHYRSKTTAARYYRLFLRASDSTRAQLRTYAEDRLDALRPTLHMEEGRLSIDDTTGR